MTTSELLELQRKQQKAKWILKIRETNMLTQTCTENLLSDITDICTNIVEDLKADILHKLTSSPITLPSTIFKEISETFDNEIYRQPFTGLETQYKQLQFYRKHLNFVVRNIKTHDSESRGQEEAGRTRRTSVLFTGSTTLN